MARNIAIVISTLFIFLVVSPGIATEKISLRKTLESTWEAYLAASNSGDESELEKTMSSYRLGMMKNHLASANRSLTPDIIKSIAEYGPNISTAEFVTLLENGPTAGLVYVEDSEEQDAAGDPQITFIFIKFVEEESGWKVDGEMSIGGPKFQEDGKKSVFDPSDLPPTYEIDGQVRKAPEPITTPDVSAFLDVFSYGYQVDVDINGVEQVGINNKSYSGLLTKGLRQGKNEVSIVVAKMDGDAPFTPRVTIRRILEDRNMEEIFKFEPKKDIEGNYTFSFTINE